VGVVVEGTGGLREEEGGRVIIWVGCYSAQTCGASTPIPTTYSSSYHHYYYYYYS